MTDAPQRPAPAAEPVGPVLENSDVARAVIAAIRASVPGAEVQDRGAYLRVLAPGRCAVRRSDIERVLGRPFRLPSDLEAVMPSFTGSFQVSSEEAVWLPRRSP